MLIALKIDKVNFCLSDVSDYQRINGALRVVDYLINAAALMHVPAN
jgi:FlaA1/EpsC-like NDP-sugar epimerase